MSHEPESENLADLVWRVMEQHARSAVLRLLNAASCYTLNAIVLRDLLDALGMHLSHDRLGGILTWLQDQQLVRVARTDATVVVTITARGADVAEDRTRHDGISRPQPG